MRSFFVRYRTRGQLEFANARTDWAAATFRLSFALDSGKFRATANFLATFALDFGKYWAFKRFHFLSPGIRMMPIYFTTIASQ